MKRPRLEDSDVGSDPGKLTGSAVERVSKRKSPKKNSSPRKPRKFGDLTEEDVLEKTLPDLIGDDLDVLFVSCMFSGWYFVSSHACLWFQIGINPSLDAAYAGHYYSGNSNHFCM